MPQAAKRPSHARKKKRAAPYRAPAAADDTAGQPAGAAKTAAKAAQKNALASNPKTSTEYVVRDAQWVAQPSTSGTRQGTAFRQPSSARAGKPSDDVRRRAAAKAMAPVDGKTALPNQGKRASGERSSSSRDAAASLATDSKRVRPALQNAGRAVAEVTAARKDEDAAKAQLDAHNNRAITRRAALDNSHSLRDERESGWKLSWPLDAICERRRRATSCTCSRVPSKHLIRTRSGSLPCTSLQWIVMTRRSWRDGQPLPSARQDGTPRR